MWYTVLVGWAVYLTITISDSSSFSKHLLPYCFLFLGIHITYCVDKFLTWIFKQVFKDLVFVYLRSCTSWYQWLWHCRPNPHADAVKIGCNFEKQVSSVPHSVLLPSRAGHVDIVLSVWIDRQTDACCYKVCLHLLPIFSWTLVKLVHILGSFLSPSV